MYTSNPVFMSASWKTRTNLQRRNRSVLGGKTSVSSHDYSKHKAHHMIIEVKIAKVRDRIVFIRKIAAN